MSRQPSRTVYATNRMNGDVMIRRAALRSSIVRIHSAISHCCVEKQEMISAAMSLDVGRAFAGAKYLPVDVGDCERIRARPKSDGSNGTRCQMVLRG